MFENILDHNEVTDILSEEIKTGKLPSSMLFYGEKYTGKLTTALELARILTCRQKGDWSCSCRSCQQQRLMDSPATVLLGGRYFLEEIEACGDVLRRTGKTAARFMYIRSLKKLTRRFDSHIWEGQEAKIKGSSQDISDINNIADLLHPDMDLPSEKEMEKLLEDASKAAVKAAGYISRDNIPISNIRNISYWAHTTNQDSAKVVILEGAENMSESSRNALLKILEEPPESVYFILISGSKNRIMPTILSRVRPYHFSPRSPEGEKNVLSRIFRDDAHEYKNLKDYFTAMRGVNLNIIRQHANKAIEDVLQHGHIDLSEFSELLNIINEGSVFESFLEEMIGILKTHTQSISENSVPLSVLEKWNGLIRETMANRSTYNQSGTLLFETLLYRMRAVL